MNLLYITNIPSPYRVDFFNELGKYCHLTVIFEKKKSTERDPNWEKYNFINFKGIFLKGISVGVDTAFCPSIIKYLKENLYDHIIFANPLTPTGIFAIKYLKSKKSRYIIEGDGAFVKSGKGFKENLKKYFLKGAHSYFSTSKKLDEYFLTYGAQESKIFRYPFSSIFLKDVIENPISKEQKKQLKIEMGIKEEYIVLTIGQFIRRKGFDVLLNASIDLDKNIGVYLIGGEPIDEYLDIINKNNLDNIYFADFQNKENLLKYFSIADVFVLPTREDIWGLVINEAMSMGLPVITTDKCIAGLELIENGVNGFIVNVENAKDLAVKINLIISDNNLLNKMSINNLQKIKYYTIENMAQKHLDILKELGE